MTTTPIGVEIRLKVKLVSRQKTISATIAIIHILLSLIHDEKLEFIGSFINIRKFFNPLLLLKLWL